MFNKYKYKKFTKYLLDFYLTLDLIQGYYFTNDRLVVKSKNPNVEDKVFIYKSFINKRSFRAALLNCLYVMRFFNE